jgi:putative polyhydroxyalkanoate system protein
MPQIHIAREHALGLSQARKLAAQWVEQAQGEFGMECEYQEGPSADTITFTRSGVSGTVNVSADQFELTAQLGFLLGSYKDRIETQIAQNLDELLASHQA